MARSRTTRRNRSAHTVVIVIAAVVAAALTGCAAASGKTSPPVVDFETQFGHIHGLGADQTTGETYAATHNGVWRIPTGNLPDSYLTGAKRATDTKVVQIAGRAQDTMGFTVAAPGLLLASGHPDPVEQPDLNPPNLGLIISTDGAKAWETLSLRGETDFHDLAAVELPDGELRAYGYDATTSTIRISNDSGMTWSSRATLQLRDLAADPTDPDRVFTTMAGGLLLSDDSGHSFAPLPGAPALFLITTSDEATGGALIGIDTNDAIWKQDETGTWSKTGQTEGTPEALEYVGGSSPWILLAAERGIVTSDDYGETGTVLVPSKGSAP